MNDLGEEIISVYFYKDIFVIIDYNVFKLYEILLIMKLNMFNLKFVSVELGE